MVEYSKKLYKDIGLQREVEDALPYAIVRGAWEGSLSAVIAQGEHLTVLSHIVPALHQLKILYLRIQTQNDDGAKFELIQSNPTATGATGTVEAFPVVGNAAAGVFDYPMVETAGAEVLGGSLVNPVHVVEGSIEFRILGHGDIVHALDDNRYGIVWWGVEKIPEPTRDRP